MNCKCKVEQRRLTPGVFNLKQFLNGSETMVWELDNCVINQGTCNLANYDAFLVLCVAGEIDEILLTKRQSGDKLQLLWDVGTYATALTGYVKYQITFRSSNFDTLGVIADDPEANGVYQLTDQNATGNDRIYQKADNGYSIKWDAENGRWALYRTDGVSVIDYQTTPSTEPHCGVWDEIGVGNNEAAAWISDEAIMYVSETIAADQKVTGNYPTILRQLWKRISKSGVTSVNGKTGIVDISPADIGAAEEEHQHEIKDIASLQETLNDKAAKSHTHKVADVTDLQAELNKKAAASHAHKITDTEGLQDALNGKAPTDHGHTIGNVTGLQDALDKKAPATHTEAEATTSTLGHVKVDGQTIVAEDGVIKAVGGLAIGSIFPFPASTPPEGAYLLNGQTIANCESLYPKFWQWLITASIRAVDSDTYEAELAATGFCDGFVVDSQTGSVRLPTWTGYMPNFKNNTLPVAGNGMTLGLTNGEVYVGLTKQTSIGTHGSSVLAYGQPINNTNGSAANATKVGFYGVTEDSSKSGIVADVSGLEKDCFHWCIQVFNAATALSEQESAQLASQMQTKAQTDLANITPSGRSLLSGLGMPSDSYVDLTLGESGTIYTAPANGTYMIAATSTNATGPAVALYVENRGGYGNKCIAYSSSEYIVSTVHVQKGATVQAYYTKNLKDMVMRFIYAEGEVE